MRDPQCLLREATLPDAWLANEKDEAPMAVDHVVEPYPKRFELMFTPDKGARSRKRSNRRHELD